MSRTRGIATLVLPPIAALIAAIPAQLWAQAATPAAPQDSQQLQRVEVTGSRIKRIDTETPSPVQVITREQIDRSGAQSVTEILTRAPAANAGSFDENAVSSFTPGAGSASLRGLGPQATLVLINGRRVSPFGFASGGQTTFVDINQIPIDAVDRIEVLLDGASAIYGSDAIGGVINVILRRDFNGLQVKAGYGRSTYGDGASKEGSIIYGKGSVATDGYNFFVNYSHIDQDPVKEYQRDRTSSGDYRRFGLLDNRSSYSYPGNLFVPNGAAGGAFIGPMPGCTPLNDPTAANNGRCVYDPSRFIDLISKSKRDALTFAGTLALSRGFELFADGTIGRTDFKQDSFNYSSATYNQTGTLPTTYIDLPIGHPQNPSTTSDTALRYRFMDVQHAVEPVSDTQRGVLGIRNSDLWGWDVESGLLYSHSKTTVKTTGIINDTVLVNEVLDQNGQAIPTFIFGNPSANDPGLMSRLYPTLRDLGTTTTASIDVRGSRDVYQLPAGSLGLAVGAELRHEKYTSTPDPITASGQLSVLGAASSDGARTIGAAYAEFSIPVVKSLEASLAARVDHYSDFGSTVNPKVGFKWKALPSLALRGTYATGFRAPAITELTTSPSTGFFSGVRDPKLCMTPDPNNPNCAVAFPATFSSNPDLQPEKSKNFTVGAIWEPVDNLSLTFDTFKIKRRNEIQTLSPDYVLAHEDQYPGVVVRNPDGTINTMNLTYSNLGSTQVWGYDIEIKASQNLGEFGKLGVIGTYDRLPQFKIAAVPGAEEVNFAGTYEQPKDRLRLGFSLDRGPWSSSLTFNYTGKYDLVFSPGSDCIYAATANPELCTIKSFLTTDLFIGYKGFKNLELNLTIKNLDNRQPPIDANLAPFLSLGNSTFHDLMGRYFTASAKYTFW
jgi:iron complex outermembrane receptor protein